jgi:hypothetical protein
MMLDNHDRMKNVIESPGNDVPAYVKAFNRSMEKHRGYIKELSKDLEVPDADEIRILK